MKSVPRIIKVDGFEDSRGRLNYLEISKECGFLVERVYYISGVGIDDERGCHAHKNLEQIMIAVSGVVDVELDNGKEKVIFKLDSIEKALYVPGGYWRVLKFSSRDAVCFVLASHSYDKNDYIFDYEKFLEYAKEESK